MEDQDIFADNRSEADKDRELRMQSLYQATSIATSGGAHATAGEVITAAEALFDWIKNGLTRDLTAS